MTAKMETIEALINKADVSILELFRLRFMQSDKM